MIFQGEEIKDISKKQENLLLELKDLYEFWNQKINVISRKDMDRFYVHHVLHSLAIAQIFSFHSGDQIMDLGCGGGFPGIPLAILFPEVSFYLTDSIGKKIKVVNEVSQSLKLENVTAVHSRAEDVKNVKFDGVVSRAVAPLNRLLIWTRPLLKSKNKSPYGLICLKGGDLAQEIHDSGKRVRIWEIHNRIFKDDWFREKYILQVK